MCIFFNLKNPLFLVFNGFSRYMAKVTTLPQGLRLLFLSRIFDSSIYINLHISDIDLSHSGFHDGHPYTI